MKPALILTATLFCSAAYSQPLTIDALLPAKGGRAFYIVPPDGVVRVTLVPSGRWRGPFEAGLRTSQLMAEDSTHATTFLARTGSDTVWARSVAFKVTGPLMRIELLVPDLRTPETYSGRLLLTVGDSVMQLPVAFRRQGVPRPAALVLDRTSVTAVVTAWPWSGGDFDSALVIPARDRNGLWPLENVRVVQEEVVASPDGASGGHQLAVRLDTTGITTLIRVRMSDLDAGTYTIRCRVFASNAMGEGQTFTITAKVHHPWPVAAVVLLLAIGTSVLGTKIIGNLNRRSALLRKLADLDTGWIGDEPATLGVVAVRAELKKIEDLSKSVWLVAPEELDTRIEALGPVLQLLRRISMLRKRLDGVSQNEYVLRRARMSLRRIAESVRLPQGAGSREAIDHDLDDLEGWTDNVADKYAESLSAAITSLLEVVTGDDLARLNKAAKTTIVNLRTLLVKSRDAMPAELDKLVSIEHEYARLKIFWERRKERDFNTFIKQHKSSTIDELFGEVDTRGWEAMQKAAASGAVWIEAPNPDTPEPLQSYQPLRFRVSTNLPQVRDIYLFKHGLVYRWVFTLQRLRPPWALTTKTLKPVTVEPRVVQFVPWPALVRAEVVVEYQGRTIRIDRIGDPALLSPQEGNVPGPGELRIAASKVFRWVKGFQTAEILSIAISSVLAVVSGLAAFYFSTETFGSLKEYVSLFLWGTGVDQAKNALQVVRGFGKEPSP